MVLRRKHLGQYLPLVKQERKSEELRCSVIKSRPARWLLEGSIAKYRLKLQCSVWQHSIGRSFIYDRHSLILPVEAREVPSKLPLFGVACHPKKGPTEPYGLSIQIAWRYFIRSPKPWPSPRELDCWNLLAKG